MTLMESIVTNPFGMVWLATTVSLSAIEFVKEGNIHWKLLLDYMVVSFLILIGVSGSNYRLAYFTV